MKTPLISIACIAIFLTSCTTTNNNGTGNIPTPPVTSEIMQQAPKIDADTVSPSSDEKTPAEVAKNPLKSYTITEVSAHATKDDCWLILDGGVYDVTSYIPRHPGGDKILRGCGKDATEMFAKHPESAKALKEQFKIGELTK